MLEFFPGGDASREPQVSDPSNRRFFLNAVGFCLMNLGRLGEAVPIYQRGNAMDLSMEDWHNASIGLENLAGLQASLGALAASAEAAGQALAMARRAGKKEDECNALVRQGWAAHLRGDLQAASAVFGQAQALQGEIDLEARYLYGPRGIEHADHLRRTGKAVTARHITEANLAICEGDHWLSPLSQCHRVLGDLDAQAGQQHLASAHYDQALKLARDIFKRDVLIEALLARGRWAARYENPSGLALADLSEALGYAVESGYRIYEVDIRVALAWAQRAAGNPSAARAEAEHGRRMSEETGYHWGQVDAAEVLAESA
jgi:tetratricopeptide (TPR) repeat protein